MATPKSSCCPKCDKKLEECADKKRCSRWRTSYDVCIIFGTRSSRPGFSGASVFH